MAYWDDGVTAHCLLSVVGCFSSSRVQYCV